MFQSSTDIQQEKLTLMGHLESHNCGLSKKKLDAMLRRVNRSHSLQYHSYLGRSTSTYSPREFYPPPILHTLCPDFDNQLTTNKANEIIAKKCLNGRMYNTNMIRNEKSDGDTEHLSQRLSSVSSTSSTGYEDSTNIQRIIDRDRCGYKNRSSDALSSTGTTTEIDSDSESNSNVFAVSVSSQRSFSQLQSPSEEEEDEEREREQQQQQQQQNSSCLELSTPIASSDLHSDDHSQKHSHQLSDKRNKRHSVRKTLKKLRERALSSSFPLMKKPSKNGEKPATPVFGKSLLGREWEIVTVQEMCRRLSLNRIDHMVMPIPDGACSSQILDESMIREIMQILPARAQGYPWVNIYNSEKHGFSLSTFYRKMMEWEEEMSPILLIVRDCQDHVFGAIASTALRPSEHFFGTGDSCLLFKFVHDPQSKQREVRAFTWTGDNQYFVKASRDSLLMGAGGGHYGIWLDADLNYGRSERCQTFDNEPLAGDCEDFNIQFLEAFGFRMQ